MTKIFTDASTTLAEANFNKLCAADGTVGSHSAGHACWGLRVRYNGAAWEAVADFGAEEQIANVGFTWDTDEVEIDLSGCDNQFNSGTYPVCVASQTKGAASEYLVRAVASDYQTILVDFTDPAGSIVTVEDTSMDFQLIMFGEL